MECERAHECDPDEEGESGTRGWEGCDPDERRERARQGHKGVARFTPATTTAQDWNATVADTKLAEPANCFTTCRFGTARAS